LDELRADDPQRIGSYTLLARLGSGGMGQVYFGRSLGGRDVAVKVIHADLARDQSFRLRFAREVETARRVGGAFTAPVIDADPDAPVPWLVTTFVNGPSLADAVGRHGPLPLSSVLVLAAGLAEGLSAVHRVGVIHRDLKPANVLLAQDGPRLIDFGISQAADYTPLTSTGMAVGTPGFMAPEQILGDPVGPACDIFTMGAVVAFAATGEQPFGTGPAGLRNQRALFLAPRLDNVPGALRPLVERCMVREPADRPSAKQFLADLVAAHPEAADQACWLPEGIRAEVGRKIQVPPRARETPTPHGEAATVYWKPPPEREEPAPAPGADRTRADASSPSAASPEALAGKPPRTPRTSRRRRIWLPVGVAAVVAALGTIIGLLVAPSAPAVVPRPTGLSALKETGTSVTLEWHAFASGSQPGEYEILENGKKLVSVPGHQTKYQVNGLRNGTVYQFSVIAVTGTSLSVPSAVILVSTSEPPSPPLADASFDWNGNANYQLITASDSFWKNKGDTWSDVWNIGSNCGWKVCAKATLNGSIDGIAFTATLVRSGVTYTGTTGIDNFWLDCLHTSNYEDSTLSIKLTGTREGQTHGSTWTITAFTGTVIWNIPELPDGCSGSLYGMHVYGSTPS
jgi:serine/threonine protein kinase